VGRTCCRCAGHVAFDADVTAHVKLHLSAHLSGADQAGVGYVSNVLQKTEPSTHPSLFPVAGFAREGDRCSNRPGDFPRWEAVYHETHRWLSAGCFEAIGHDVRELLREAQGRNAQPTAAIFDRRTRQSSTESGARAGSDRQNRSYLQSMIYERQTACGG
jgi:transposase